MSSRVADAFERFDRAELTLCRCLNRSSGLAAIRQLFRAVSWLGDGWLWFALIALLPALYGAEGWMPAVHMVAAGGAGFGIYKLIKPRAVRERPYITHTAIHCVSAPLDKYSFPSGHTLHAVSFTILMTHYFPEWAGLLAAFAVLVALSRVILGLHYPTDVVAGGLLGALIADGSLGIAGMLPA